MIKTGAKVLAILSAAAMITGVVTAPVSAAARATKLGFGQFLPNAEASKIVTVTTHGKAAAWVIVMTKAVAIKETGPKETVAKFGEVYAFTPTFFAVRRGQPTEIAFWNLQPDDLHSFALMGPDKKILMYVVLPPLSKTSFVFTFHHAGVFDFSCLQHQPEMAGQILVLPPTKN